MYTQQKREPYKSKSINCVFKGVLGSQQALISNCNFSESAKQIRFDEWTRIHTYTHALAHVQRIFVTIFFFSCLFTLFIFVFFSSSHSSCKCFFQLELFPFFGFRPCFSRFSCKHTCARTEVPPYTSPNSWSFNLFFFVSFRHLILLSIVSVSSFIYTSTFSAPWFSLAPDNFRLKQKHLLRSSLDQI